MTTEKMSRRRSSSGLNERQADEIRTFVHGQINGAVDVIGEECGKIERRLRAEIETLRAEIAQLRAMKTAGNVTALNRGGRSDAA
jgi:hypothetical protein